MLFLSARADRKENFTMHDLIVAGSFLLMVLAPCLVAMRSGATDED